MASHYDVQKTKVDISNCTKGNTVNHNVDKNDIFFNCFLFHKILTQEKNISDKSLGKKKEAVHLASLTL